MYTYEQDTTIEVRIFDLQPLKRLFFSMAALSVVISAAGVALAYLLPPLLPPDHFLRHYAIHIIIGYGILNSFLAGGKKMLEAVRATEPFDARCKAYERFYRRRIAAIVITAFVNAVLLVLTRKYFILILVGLQLLALAASYPYPSVIRKQLKDDDMVFQ